MIDQAAIGDDFLDTPDYADRFFHLLKNDFFVCSTGNIAIGSKSSNLRFNSPTGTEGQYFWF